MFNTRINLLILMIFCLNLKCFLIEERCNCDKLNESTSILFTVLVFEESKIEDLNVSCFLERNDSCLSYEKGHSIESLKMNCSILNGKFELNSQCSRTNSFGECNIYLNESKYFSKKYYNLLGLWSPETAKTECLIKLKGEWKTNL